MISIQMYQAVCQHVYKSDIQRLAKILERILLNESEKRLPANARFLTIC